jgi:hypothetical protein
MILYRESDQGGNLPEGDSVPQMPRAERPEYGERVEPDYGQMESQYPGWDPYVYGKPDPDPEQQTTNPNTQPGQQNQPQAVYSQGSAAPFNPNAQYSQGNPENQGNHMGQGPQNPQNPQNLRNPNNFFFQGTPVNLDDPNQNPVYGHYDPFAIIGFVLSIFGVWFFSLPLCIMSFRRIPRMHMRGRFWAGAGIVISILQLIFEFVMLFGGFNPGSLFPSLSGGGSGGSSGTSV